MHIIDEALDTSMKILQDHPLLSTKITRVEVISEYGRVFSDRCKEGKFYKLSLQDDGRTLKLFEITKGEK